MGYTNGTWLQLQGRGSGENRRWVFTHFEPYLRRTYHGSTSELTNLLGEVLSGKAVGPPPMRPKYPDWARCRSANRARNNRTPHVW